ncbi:MAG: DUF4340 domain-containing protein [Myxococcota bacterium]
MQWRKNRVAIGAVVFVALLATTVWAVTTRDRPAEDAVVELPTISIDEDAIVAMEITRPGEAGAETVVLEKVEDEWRVTSPLDADADANNVSSALNRLSALTPIQIVATREENHARLEVDDAQAVTVIARMGDETPPLDVRIGKYANGVTMIRIDDRPEVFGVKGSARFPFDRDLKNWRDRRVTQEEAKTVDRVTFESENGDFAFTMEDGAWVPEGKYRRIEDFDGKQVAGLVSTAARLTASGFASEDVSNARAGLNEPKGTVTLYLSTDTPEGSDAEEGGEPDEGAQSIVVLEVGDEDEESSEYYLQRKGDPTIYLVSSYLANRLQPGPEAFERPPEPAAPPTPQALPGQMPGQPNQLPPEVMQQLQQQLQQQQR